MSSTKEEEEAPSRPRTGGMPRKWLRDRCDGTSQPVATTPRPPSRICYAPPIVKYFPDIFEQNRCCEAIGAFGCFGLIDPAHAEHNIRFRRRVLSVCLVINVVGLVFLILSSLAISRNSFGLVWGFSFTNIWLEVVKGSAMYDGPVAFGVGLRAAAYNGLTRGSILPSGTDDGNDSFSSNSTNTTQLLIPFDQFCEIAAMQPRSQEEVAVQAFENTFEESTGTDCGSCSDMSHKIVPSLFLSMLGYIPNFIADVQRMYPGYDINMSKCSASIFSWLTVATGIYTWANYHINCFAYLGDGETEGVAVDEEFNVVDPNSDEARLVIRVHWSAAFGEVCLAVSMFLKIIDIVLQGMLPTPTITRDYQEQVDYELRYGDARDGAGDRDERNP